MLTGSGEDVLSMSTGTGFQLLQEMVEEAEVMEEIDLIDVVQEDEKIYIRLIANTAGLQYPIDLDPTVFVKFYDRGARTFAPDFSNGNQNGKYSQTNNPGRVNRGTESFLPQNGLVGYWPMDGDFDDDSGNGNDGTGTGGVTTTTGKFGEAGDFDGVDDYVYAVDSASLDVSSEVTVSAWVNPDQTPLGADA